MRLMFEYNQWSGRKLEYPTEWTKRQIESFLIGHKDEIIQCAGELLAEKLARTKAAKEMLGGLAEEKHDG